MAGNFRNISFVYFAFITKQLFGLILCATHSSGIVYFFYYCYDTFVFVYNLEISFFLFIVSTASEVFCIRNALYKLLHSTIRCNAIVFEFQRKLLSVNFFHGIFLERKSTKH